MSENKTLAGDNRIRVTEQAGTRILKARDPNLGLTPPSCRRAILPTALSHTPVGSLGETSPRKDVPVQSPSAVNANLSSTSTLTRGG